MRMNNTNIKQINNFDINNEYLISDYDNFIFKRCDKLADVDLSEYNDTLSKVKRELGTTNEYLILELHNCLLHILSKQQERTYKKALIDGICIGRDII